MPDEPSDEEMDVYYEAVRETGRGLSRWLDDNKIPPVVAGAALMKLAALITLTSIPDASDGDLMELWRTCVDEIKEKIARHQTPEIIRRWFERGGKGRVM